MKFQVEIPILAINLDLKKIVSLYSSIQKHLH